MSNWQRIREARTDLTDYVVHLTRFVVDGDNGRRDVKEGRVRLKEIIRSGYLLPTAAHRITRNKNRNPTVRGPHKAVCFTGQPLEQIPATVRHGCGTGYKEYGIALHKADLFNYGGRPAIYGDEALFASLDDEFKYRWVRYHPVRPGGGDPVDFTFEREWRSRIASTDTLPWGHDLPGVPLLLPDDFTRVSLPWSSGRWMYNKVSAPDFRILVKWDIDVKPIRDFINGLAAGPDASNYHQVYYRALKKAQVISLEQVERKLLDEGDTAYRRIEYLPFPEDIVSPSPKKMTMTELFQQIKRRSGQ